MKKVEKSSSAGTTNESSTNADVQHVSQPIAKPNVVGSLFALYPNSEMMGLADENKPVAWFKYKEHAEEFGKAKYGKYYVVKTWA